MYKRQTLNLAFWTFLIYLDPTSYGFFGFGKLRFNDFFPKDIFSIKSATFVLSKDQTRTDLKIQTFWVNLKLVLLLCEDKCPVLN